MSKPDNTEFARLVDLAEARLLGDWAADTDDETRAVIDWLRAFVWVSENKVLAVPPPELHDELVARFEAHAEAERQPGLLRRLVATLSFDSGLQPALGLRSADAANSRQLFYISEAADVALSLRSRPGGSVDVDGQIFPRESEAEHRSFSVQLLGQAETSFATTATADLDEFAFEDVPADVYELVLGGEQIEIRVPGVELHP